MNRHLLLSERRADQPQKGWQTEHFANVGVEGAKQSSGKQRPISEGQGRFLWRPSLGTKTSSPASCPQSSQGTASAVPDARVERYTEPLDLLMNGTENVF